MRDGLTTQTLTNPTAWDAQVNALGGHPLQLWGWGEVKAHGAWRAHRLEIADSTRVVGLAQVLVRPLPAQFKALSHIPRGPVIAPPLTGTPAGPGLGDEETRSKVTRAVVDWCMANVGGVGITLEPDWPVGTGLELPKARTAVNPILYPKTLILDLTRTEEELIAAMSRTTKKDLRKGDRSGLEIRRVTSEDEVRQALAVYHQTAARAGFALHDDEYYLDIHRYLGEHSVLVAAFVDGAVAAFLWCVCSATTSFELYGGQNDAGREARANAPLKWYAIKRAKQAGLARYDMNGLLNDGISEFKRRFAQHEDELVGSIDVPFSRWYGAWNKGLPTAKRVVRRLRGAAA